MLQTTNYFSHIHPADYNPITHPIIYGTSSARNILIHGAVWFNFQMLLCTNHHTNNHAQNKALLEGMFAGWVEEYNEWNEAAANSMKDRDKLIFEICDMHFVTFGMQAIFSELDIDNLPFDYFQHNTWQQIARSNKNDFFHLTVPHARATVLSNASKFFKVSELPKLNTNLLNVWDSHQNTEIPVRIAHNGVAGCLVDENGKVRKKAEFGYKSKEQFLLEIQNGK